MAHTKSGGSTKLGRDSRSKRLGIKTNHLEAVKIGEIIVRQRGTHYFPGINVARGGDDTLYALKSGVVKFRTRKKSRFNGSRHFVKIVNVITAEPPLKSVSK